MDIILRAVLDSLSKISVSGVDVERMYIAKHQLRQLLAMIGQ